MTNLLYKAYILALLVLISAQIYGDDSRSNPRELSTYYSVENTGDITNEDMDRLLAFLPAIQSESSGWREEDYFQATKLQAFHHELLRKWVRPFNWSLWKEKAEGYANNPELLKEASLADIVKMITLHVRTDRSHEGHLLTMIKDGNIEKLLERVKDIRSSNEHLAKN